MGVLEPISLGDKEGYCIYWFVFLNYILLDWTWGLIYNLGLDIVNQSW